MPSGSCACGAIKYSFTGQPSVKCLCHCLSCRKLTSSTAASLVLIPDANFTTTQSPSSKQNTITHEAGIKITYTFCSDCGSVCWKSADDWPEHHIVFTGTLDDDAEFRELSKPDVEFWVKHRAGWAGSLEGQGVKQVEGFPEN